MYKDVKRVHRRIYAHNHAWPRLDSLTAICLWRPMVMPFRQHNAVDIRENWKASNALHVLLVIVFFLRSVFRTKQERMSLNVITREWTMAYSCRYIHCVLYCNQLGYSLAAPGIRDSNVHPKKWVTTWPLLTGIRTFSLHVPPSNITPWLQILKCKNTCS